MTLGLKFLFRGCFLGKNAALFTYENIKKILRENFRFFSDIISQINKTKTII